MIMKKFTFRIKKDSIIVVLYWVLYFCSAHIHTGNANLIVPSSILGCAILVLTIRKYGRPQKNIYRPILVFLISALFSIIIVGNVGWYYIVFLISNIGISYKIFIDQNSYNNNSTIYRNILILIIISYFVYYFFHKSFAELYNLASENTVSISLIAFFYLYVNECKRKGRNVSVVLAMLCTILCIWGNGRTGIACSLLMTSCIILIKFLKAKGGVTLDFLLIILGIAFGVIIICFGGSILYSIIDDRPRQYIWQLYIGGLNDWKNIIFGVPFSLNDGFEAYINNLHNTFLNIHAKYGLVAFCTCLVMIIVMIKKFVKNKNLYGILFVLLFILRSITDNTSFIGPMDYMFFGLFFQSYNKSM